MKDLIDLYEAWNKSEKAEEWPAKMPQTEAKRKLETRESHLLMAEIENRKR